MNEQELGAFLGRTQAFHSRVARNISSLEPAPAPRFIVSFQAGILSIEHALAAHLLISQTLNAPGYALLRPQFEAVVRGVWLLHAASDTWVEKLTSPLNLENAVPANDGLMLAEMIKQLDASDNAPTAIVDQLKEFRDVAWKAMNSYTHGGLHPLSRSVTGYPPKLSYDVLRNSNALVAIASQLLAIVTGDPKNMEPVRTLHAEFADCLPIIH